MTKIGGREKPPEFFAAIRDVLEFGRDWSLYVAELAGEKIGALLLFHSATTVEYIMPGIADEARNMQPTALLIAQGMRDAVSRGCRRWNWGGTWLSQEGDYPFKRKWGCQRNAIQIFHQDQQRTNAANDPGRIGRDVPVFLFRAIQPFWLSGMRDRLLMIRGLTSKS